MVSLGTLAFFAPWAFLGFLALPVIWWFIRLTPPRARHIGFPSIRLLMRVERTESISYATSLWLLILRMGMISILIFAAARPIHNPGTQFPSEGPLILVIDDGWAAAKDWDARTQQAEGLILQAQRQGRNVILIPTAPRAAATPIEILDAGQAIEFLNSLQPKPWPVDRDGIMSALTRSRDVVGNAGQIVWLFDGVIPEGHGDRFINTLEMLRQIGPVRLVEPQIETGARVLYPPHKSGVRLTVPVRRVWAGDAEPVTLVAYDDDGRAIGNAVARFDEGSHETEAIFELPVELRNRMDTIRLDGERTAAGTLMLDERWRRRPVGLIREKSLADYQPLLNDVYYLDRALEPVTDVSLGSLDSLLDREMAVIVMPDPGIIETNDKAQLDQWINDGGVLVVFAGPRLVSTVQQQSFSPIPLTELLPVELRLGGRAIGGTMSWRKPAGIADFSEDSPFHGLAVPREVDVRQQVLAEPDLDIEQKTWARLADGTPLVTAAARGDGWSILFHVSANAEWSTLPLSGLFVEMLQRIVEVSRGLEKGQAQGALEPARTLDGFGALVAPPAGVSSLMMEGFETAVPSFSQPPGFYGSGQTIRAFNLSTSIGVLESLGEVPSTIERVTYRQSTEIDLVPWMLAIAMAMFVLDLVLSTDLARFFRRGGELTTRAAGAIVFVFVFVVGVAVPGAAVLAQDSGDENTLIDVINNTRLAYVLSGNDEVDEISRLGLRGLSVVLAQRTAVELALPVAVDVEEDDLVFYPLIYWPITGSARIPSSTAAENVNAFLANGGTILFDMQQSGAVAGLDQLRRLASVLDIPRLVPVPGDHVLTRSYYLINDFPGRWAGGRVWIVPANERVNDGVSPVVAGGHQWAGAWALDDTSQPLYAAVPGGERQREFAFRFGINLVMYVLTGNYKGDQVHLPAILERLN